MLSFRFLSEVELKSVAVTTPVTLTPPETTRFVNVPTDVN
jgi:hypothetical protein